MKRLAIVVCLLVLLGAILMLALRPAQPPPAAPVVWLRLNPTFAFFSVTVAPDTILACASEISPRTVDVPVCALAPPGKNRSVQKKAKMPIVVKDDFIDYPFRVP